MSSERHLWAAVLGLAFDDLRDKRTGTACLQTTRLWLASNISEPGSFLWICDYLELDAESIRRVAPQSAIAQMPEVA
jgi:hypothetical protein